MLHEQRFEVPASPADLHVAYESLLANLLEDRDLETVAADTDVDSDVLEILQTGGSPELSVTEAAAIQALDDDTPDPETIETMACEHLLLGMSSAVLDVEALERAVDLSLDAKEIQQKLERRAPMSLAEFAHLEWTIVDQLP